MLSVRAVGPSFRHSTRCLYTRHNQGNGCSLRSGAARQRVTSASPFEALPLLTGASQTRVPDVALFHQMFQCQILATQGGIGHACLVFTPTI